MERSVVVVKSDSENDSESLIDFVENKSFGGMPQGDVTKSVTSFVKVLSCFRI